jgi:hypothetical protein
MKKLLLASVATLAVAAFAAGAQAADSKAEGLKLGLGGYHSVHGAWIDQDSGTGAPGANRRDSDVFSYGEINFGAEKTFDNGLTVGYKAVAPVGAAAATDNFNENFAYFSGYWGRVVAGQDYSPVYYMAVRAPAVDAGIDGADPDFNFVNITAATVTSSAVSTVTVSGGYVGAGNYAHSTVTPFAKQGGLYSDKIAYYTPRFNGFQLGASYTPEQARKASTTAGFSLENDAGQQSERVEVAANYEGAFEGVGVKVSGGYSTGELEALPAADTTLAKDTKAWEAGLSLNYMGFTLGGEYLNDNNGQSFSGTNASTTIAAALRSVVSSADGETETWAAGLGYDFGPYNVGVSYLNSQVDVVRLTSGAAGNNASAIYNKDTDELERIVLGGNYKVAPGVNLGTTLQFHEYSNTYGGVSGNNDATVFTVGTTVNF